jgi:hypothetical protein
MMMNHQHIETLEGTRSDDEGAGKNVQPDELDVLAQRGDALVNELLSRVVHRREHASAVQHLHRLLNRTL